MGRAAILALFTVACRSSPDPGEAIDDASAADAPLIGKDADDQMADQMADASPPITGPTKLSDTGLYSDFASRTIDPQHIPVLPRYPLWSDGDTKARYLYLPPGAKIETSDPDNWKFPLGMKMWKEFRVGGKLVETRLIEKVGDGAWWMVAYAWQPDGSDAIAAPDGVPDALGTTHDIPSQQSCNFCHGNVADVNIGLGVIQLSGTPALAKLTADGRLTVPVVEKEVPGTGDVKAALGYLHGNCGHCHNDVGWVHQVTALQLRVPVAAQQPEDSRAYGAVYLRSQHVLYTDAGAGLGYEIIPGQPDESQLFARISRRDVWQMPPICTKVVDDPGVALVRSWIITLANGPTAVRPF